MHARHIPYAIGLFALLPVGLWLGLWAFVIPGPKNGFDAPLVLGLVMALLPLLAWFYLSTLGMLANSIEGKNAYGRPRQYFVDRVLLALPQVSVIFGTVAVAMLLMAGESVLLGMIPLAVSILCAVAIFLGERARRHDLRAQRAAVAKAGTIGRQMVGAIASATGRLVFAIPVIGLLLREAVEGSDSDRTWFAISLLLAGVMAVIVFGPSALIVMGLAGTLVAFGLIIAVARG